MSTLPYDHPEDRFARDHGYVDSGHAPQHPLPHRARSSRTLHHVVVTGDPITVSDDDDGLAAALSDRINEFNTDATGFDDGRWLRAAQRGRDGKP